MLARFNGYHEKYDLETWVCHQIKANRLDPHEAFDKLTTDWVKYYEEIKPGHPERARGISQLFQQSTLSATKQPHRSQ
jgi:hypothetical protein